MDKIIVKVQLPRNGNMDFALVYNEGKSFQTAVTVLSVQQKMNGSEKKFFYLEQSPDGKAFRIGEEAPWQNW